MTDLSASIGDVADALALPGAVERLRGIPGFNWHDLSLALFANGKPKEMRIALDEYGRAFRSRPVVVREPYLFGRIGEGAAAFATLAHLRRMNKLSVLPVLLCDRGAANPAYVGHWRKHFDVLDGAAVLRERYGEIPELQCGFLPDTDGRMHHVGDAYAMARMMDDRPLLELSEAEIERGRDALHSLGMPRQAWFVCLHARSPAYLGAAGVDDRHNAYRNSDIKSFARAAHQIAERGGWVVRIGAPGVERMPAWPNSIDLPHYHPSTDWLDLFAMGACRFFLGDSSGPIAVAATFSRPVVGVNLQLGSPSTWMALHMPKLYRRSGGLLTISEAIKAGMFMRQKVPPDDIEVVDNTAEEIERAVVEYLDGCVLSYEPQEAYRHKFPVDITRVIGTVSPAFLEKHAEVLR